ncbi:MAG: hypothetical protein M4579_004662 [Chaenotheca gracillima]|nr:MAG: hypothetical protein M4579_004662 [Chaenotheca gracillima]
MGSQTSTKLPTNAVWLITGCSSGMGKELARHVVSQGQRVVATARKVSDLSFLPDNSSAILKLPLDVVDTQQIKETFAQAIKTFGQVDVVVNNAGYGLLGEFEGTADAPARHQFEVNFWGVANVTREALHVLRDLNPPGQGGTIAQVSSVGGYVGTPLASIYQASKFAVEGLTEVISKETDPAWNIKFLIFEPGAVATDWSGRSMVMVEQHPAYKAPHLGGNQMRAYKDNLKDVGSDPAVVASVMFNAVKTGNGGRLRLPLGADAWGLMRADVTEMDKTLTACREISESTKKNSDPRKHGDLAFLN